MGSTTLSASIWVSTPGGPLSIVTHSMAGPAGRRSGSTVSLMASVTAWVEFGLMTTIGACIDAPALRRERAGAPTAAIVEPT